MGTSELVNDWLSKGAAGRKISLYSEAKNDTAASRWWQAFRIVLSRIQLVFVTASGLVLGLFRLIRSTVSWVFERFNNTLNNAQVKQSNVSREGFRVMLQLLFSH